MKRFEIAVIRRDGIDAPAKLNPERKFPASIEPMHGPARNIVGRGIANTRQLTDAMAQEARCLAR